MFSWSFSKLKDYETCPYRLTLSDAKTPRASNPYADAGIQVHQTIETLSKGFRHRVCLAQAIIHDPEVLVLDEPTDGLDPNQKHDMRELIASIAPGKAIVISTHILEEVEAICSRVVIIAEGRVVADSTPSALLDAAAVNGQRPSLETVFRSITGSKAA